MGDEKKRPGSKAAKAPGSKPRRTKNKAKLIGGVIAQMEAKLKSEDLKPSVGDLIRLLQLEKELEEEQPREIEVSWVEPVDENENRTSVPGAVPSVGSEVQGILGTDRFGEEPGTLS
jgi:hypothetical protein